MIKGYKLTKLYYSHTALEHCKNERHLFMGCEEMTSCTIVTN